MLVAERQEEIMRLLRIRKSITVVELSSIFFTCESTIRRDLTTLEKAGFLKRTYGGAILIEGMEAELPFLARETEKKSVKNHIGRLAAQLVKNGDIILMDASTTTWHMLPHLVNKKELIVMTSGAKTAIDLASATSARVISTGGNLRENSLTYIGEVAMRTVAMFRYDTLFFSCCGMKMGDGLFDVVMEEVALCRIMMKYARKIVLLMDDSKFDVVGFSRISGFEHIDYLITNREPSQEWKQYLAERKITLLY